MSEQAQTGLLVLALFATIIPAFWLLVTALLAWLSGWFRLRRRFPDSDATAFAILESRSGQMGRFLLIGIGYGYSLHFDLCAPGLRVRVARLLGPFSRPFLVPWPEIRAEWKRFIFFRWIRLAFGDPVAGTLSISSRTAAELADLSGGRFAVPSPAP